MKITKTALLEKAKDLSVKGISKKTKPEIIRALQSAEGNNPCFQQISNCGIQECLYRSECQ